MSLCPSLSCGGNWPSGATLHARSFRATIGRPPIAFPAPCDHPRASLLSVAPQTGPSQPCRGLRATRSCQEASQARRGSRGAGAPSAARAASGAAAADRPSLACSAQASPIPLRSPALQGHRPPLASTRHPHSQCTPLPVCRRRPPQRPARFQRRPGWVQRPRWAYPCPRSSSSLRRSSARGCRCSSCRPAQPRSGIDLPCS